MEKDEIEIDLQEVFAYLLYRSWIMIIAMVVCAAGAFVYTKEFVEPMYQSDAMLYVNATTEIGDISFSVADVGIGSDLIETYTVILQTRDTLQDIIDYTGCGYLQTELSDMISASAVGGTDVMQIVVVNEDPVMAESIASAITKILPEKIAEIIDGTSVHIVDTAVIPSYPYTPSFTKNILIGALLGLFISGAVLVLKVLLEKKITSVEYLKETYSNMPLLAVIPTIEISK